MAQHTIDLPCSLDTWVDKLNPSTTHGSDTQLKSNYNFDTMAIALLKFDISSLPLRKKIVSVSFRFFVAAAMSNINILMGKTWVSWDGSSTWSICGEALQREGLTTIAQNVSFAAGYYHEYVLTPALSNITDPYTTGYQLLCNGADLYIQSREGANPPMLRVVYEDVPPDTPTPKDPVGDFKDNKADIRFEWTYNSSVGGAQKKFDLQWSVDQVNWTTVSQTTANNYYDMPANTFPAGNIYWRVHCYNEYDEVGEYCSIQSFYAVGAPTAPAINPIQTNSARPIVSWSAFGQQIYQMQVLSGTTVIYDSGDQPSISVRQHKVMAFLADGTYTVNLRIKNQYNLWSDWGEATVTISTVKPAKPAFTMLKTQYGLQSKASLKDVDYALLYRDGLCVKKQTEISLIDNLVRNGNGEEGIAYWNPFNNNATLSIVNGKFRVTSVAGGTSVYQNVKVKPNTNYYLTCNMAAGSQTPSIIVYNTTWTAGLRNGVGTFNTGTYSEISVNIAPLLTGYADFDSIILIEGTTAPAAYKSYMEDYIVDDNAVINGKSYSYTARAVQEIPERSITNPLGADGDCESLSVFAGNYDAALTVVLESTYKCFGVYSHKATLNTGKTFGKMYENLTVKAGEYYFISGYVKNGNLSTGIRIGAAAISTSTNWVRQGFKIAVTTDGAQEINYILAGSAGQYGYADGLMPVKITEEEYNTLSVDQLLAKYPFGNNIFTAPAYEVYNDSVPVSATAEFKNALVAPVSDLTNVFAFTRSLNAPPKRVHDSTPGGAMVQYAGRKYPVWEPDEHISEGLSCGAFYLETWADIEAFDAIYYLNGTVLYRDAKGRKIYGVLSNRQVIEERLGYTISFVISQVDYNEEVEV